MLSLLKVIHNVSMVTEGMRNTGCCDNSVRTMNIWSLWTSDLVHLQIRCSDVVWFSRALRWSGFVLVWGQPSSGFTSVRQRLDEWGRKQPSLVWFFLYVTMLHTQRDMFTLMFTGHVVKQRFEEWEPLEWITAKFYLHIMYFFFYSKGGVKIWFWALVTF